MADPKGKPNKNSDGQQKQPAANPSGGPAPSAPPSQGGPPGPANTAPPPGAAQLTPGIVQVAQTANALNGVPGIPNTPGAGVPEGLQSFPNDAAQLMQLMQQGFAPGADNFSHAQAQNASAIARAQEAAARAQHNDAMLDEQHSKMLGALMQSLSMSGRLPPPHQVAAAMAGPSAGAPQGPPQLQSGIAGGPQASY